MNRPDGEAVKLLVDSLRIYSPTKGEEELAGFLADSMKRLGYSRVRLDGAGNVVGEVGKGKPRLLLCGHMDTVPGKLPVRRTREAVYGRGAADAKSPLCALLLAGARAADAGVRITFAGATEEEGDGAGVEQLANEAAPYDYAVFGEPSGADRITIGYRGRMSLRVVVRTPGGHAGSPWAHRSAFDEFTSILSRLREYEAGHLVQDDHFRSVSISPTLVRAGSYQNVVPGLCEATFDVRLPPGLSSAQVLGEIRPMVEARWGEVRAELNPGPPTEAYEADVGSRLVRAFQRAILLRLGKKPSLVRKTGTGDMNTFASRKGVSCLTYGPGLSGTSHTEEEAVRIRDYLDGIEVAREAIGQLVTMSVG
ncbi:MAG: M20/M25/M40 family metallo-hydrolase [Nitrososphaerota archaeon]|jgi:LysW-gamma-L-lysine carboxypeptidase|nr:M20/M25/M40 family metallo-hydrolase [Nitrososphaerota archaeon]MDG6903924.1 M20/M25/M40 family metallo-hydrolase [Nitrososphaerota archaeon]MDG6912697.1 M20/M25/M40 family metallo-hydrolase [Nitrososphaerota archaeon]MDG6919163.1 M20/M25/M40 family metallo-hydrolase [Nitrososphaerota archaeon]MDG6920567.1 M20/M25/M40 family metallo-hydrolase [Nitrososphaerota archaeon]